MNYEKNLDFKQNNNYKIKQSKMFKKELTESINYIKNVLFNHQAAIRLLNRIEKETEKLSYSARAYYLLQKIEKWQSREQTTHNQKLYYYLSSKFIEKRSIFITYI